MICPICNTNFEQRDKYGNMRQVCSTACSGKSRSKGGRAATLTRYHTKRKQLGLCRQCADKSIAGKTLCAVCTKKAGIFSRRTHIRQRYRMTPANFEQMREEQENKCKICREEFDGRIHIDHCHRTDRVRALLCQGCNVGLGNFRDNPAYLAEAIGYLEAWI